MNYADWDYWKQIPKTDLYSAVKLSFGIDPREDEDIPSAKRNPCQDLERMPDDLLKERHQIAIANLNHGLDVEALDSPKGNGFCKVSLAKFKTWALLKGWEIPPELEAMAGAKNSTQINDTPTNVDKALTTIERDSLLKLIIGMAVKGYGYDPKANKSSAAKEIEADLAELGLSLSDDTIRKYLKEGVEQLPAKLIKT